MSVVQNWWPRLGLLCALVDQAPGKTLRRTAIMKLPFLLQAVRGVPLAYDFRLYTYGPFDSDVLDDLAYAEAIGAVTEETVYFTNGYGYDVRPGPRCAEVQKLAKDWLVKHQDDVAWAIHEFGRCSAAELELISTIVFVGRDNARQGKAVSIEELARQAQEVKPHFGMPHVLAKCRELRGKRYLAAASP